MFTIRSANERGHINYGWLDTYHSFSFGSYYDPNHMGFHTLRVINEDIVQPGQGFGTHPHRNMEIVTYILEGALEHKDSMGNGSVINKGDVQRMSAGTGITHSEFNPSKNDPVHLLQLWVYPNQKNITPEYEQRHFSLEEKRNTLKLIASPNGLEDSLKVNANFSLYSSVLDNKNMVQLDTIESHHIWIQIIKGKIHCNGETLSRGDGIGMNGIKNIKIDSLENETEFLLFDLF